MTKDDFHASSEKIFEACLWHIDYMIYVIESECFLDEKERYSMMD